MSLNKGVDFGQSLCPVCSLFSSRSRAWVGGSFDPDTYTDLMIVGEAPGQKEVEAGVGFVGDSGMELDNYLRRVGLDREKWYVTNLVKCRPPKNRAPGELEIACCGAELEREIEALNPKVIAAVGKYATRWFLGEDVDMEMVHGIPYHWGKEGRIVVPCYHPAYGLRDTAKMTEIIQDFQVIREVLNGETGVRVYNRGSQAAFIYTLIEKPEEVRASMAFNKNLLAVDTESILPDGINGVGIPWCLTFAVNSENHGFMIKAGNEECLQEFRSWVQADRVTVVLHNALYDLKVLAQMGVYPKKYHDTMGAAYLLQDLPKGLKPLGYRLLDVKMTAYEDMIREKQIELSLDYFRQIAGRKWPDPPQELVFDKRGIRKVKKPQNIIKKVKRALGDLAKNSQLDLQERWEGMDGKNQVEEVLGRFPVVSLADVPFTAALKYACTDAIVTGLVYPILIKRLQDQGLMDVFEADMAILPMINDMQSLGMRIDPEYLRGLSRYFADKMETTQREIEELYYQGTKERKVINPGSTEQVSEVLWRLGIFRNKKQSTASEELDKVRGKHPIVNKVTYYKKIQKLDSTYARKLPDMVDGNNRLHTKISYTRTATGRLASSEPNLQNQPKRGEEGKKIRKGFIADPGYVLLSGDYSQIEMRVAAHESQDPIMLKLLLDPEKDIHSETAAWVFNIPVSMVDKDKHRYPAKRVGFGIVYGLTGAGLQKQLLAEGIIYSQRDCDRMVDSWLKMYQGVDEYLKKIKSFARRYGYVMDMAGRRRLTPEVYSVHPRIREAGLRQAINMPIQAGAVEIIKKAMKDLTPVCKEWVGEGWIKGPLIQIHDDLIFEVREERVGEVAPVIKILMENAGELCVPTPVAQQVGVNWGELKGVKI